jgi:hypothetical protein
MNNQQVHRAAGGETPVNAPKCPHPHFQQDGHMAMSNPVTRANYEPNSWPGAEGGPREDPAAGFRSYQEETAGVKRRLRPESFADHYSQARQFYISQTDVERKHIAEAFTFELSKCEREGIRTRMVAGLRNVDEELAAAVAEGLGLRELPALAEPACPPRRDLPASPALSILGRDHGHFAGRKLGVLVTNGADAETLAARPPARDFVTDAVAHCKFVGYTSGAAVLFEAAGLPMDPADEDEGFISLSEYPASVFIARCGRLRFWQREFAAGV